MSSTPVPALTTYEYCDLVMKGGITSGVIYPAAAVKLAERYRFKNIGGTSAGAIAASVVAAAEFGRRAGNTAAFDVLKNMPDNLASNGHLLKLFTPDKRTGKIFHVALGTMSCKSTAGKILKGVTGLLLASPLASVPTFLLGLVLPTTLFCLLAHHSLTPIVTIVTNHPWVCGICGALTGFAFALVSAAYFGFRASVSAIASNGFGLCSGMASQTGSGGSLTEWIDEQIQTAAGLTNKQSALTFGDLWTAKPYPGECLVAVRTINFQAVTTGISDGRPFTIPFLKGAFYFDPEEWKAYFPRRILSDMAAAGEKYERHKHPRIPGVAPTGDQRDVVAPAGQKLCRLPRNEELPILVATRMSLSFPGLLSAVPLYSVDYRIARNQAPGTEYDTRVGSKLWFSDGGICSNFPIGCFDSPLPRWPTFGINLQPASTVTCALTERPAAAFVTLPPPVGDVPSIGNFIGDAVWAPTGVTEQEDPFKCIANFANAIINTMQNWQDNLQAGAPGFRDRIVTVALCPDEGGLNLNMAPALIAALSARGTQAASLLVDPPVPGSSQRSFDFSQHIFTRFRITLCALQDYLQELDMSYGSPLPQDSQGWSYIKGTNIPPHYKWAHPNIRDKAAQALVELQDLIQAWEQELKEQDGFCTDAPRPKGVLQTRPEF